MFYRLPASQSPFTAKDVEITDAVMFVRAEIEHVVGFVIKRGHFVAFRVDDGSEIDRGLEMAVFGDGVPDVGFSISAGTVGNEVKDLIIGGLHQTRLHCGAVVLVY